MSKQLIPSVNLSGLVEDKVMELVISNLEKRADAVFAKAPVYVKLSYLLAIIVVGKIVEWQQAKAHAQSA